MWEISKLPMRQLTELEIQSAKKTISKLPMRQLTNIVFVILNVLFF